MSVYHTKYLTRNEAENRILDELDSIKRRIEKNSISNDELEDLLFSLFGREGLAETELANYIIK